MASFWDVVGLQWLHVRDFSGIDLERRWVSMVTPPVCLVLSAMDANVLAITAERAFGAIIDFVISGI